MTYISYGSSREDTVGNKEDTNNAGQFISLWELFAQIGKAETAYVEQAAGRLVSCLDNDPTGINFIRCRDEGIALPIGLDTRLHLLHQLSIFASQATLFDADGVPNDAAQTTFERFGFYASDIYPYLARNDVAVLQPGDEGSGERVFPDGRRIPGWILSYDGHAWLSRTRAAKILTAGMSDAEPCLARYEEIFWKWDAALSDAVERGAIVATIIVRKQMLAHADILAWCQQHGYVWLAEGPEPHQANTPESEPGAGDMAATNEILPAPLKSAAPKLKGVQLQQEEEILRVLQELGYEPNKLPKRISGKPGVKAEVCKVLNWQGKRFDKAWERLRADGKISD